MIKRMPKIAFGTWQITDKEILEQVIPTALRNGYHHIDTAQVYGNEAMIGDILSKLDIPRDQYWLTTKVTVTNFGRSYDSVKESLDKLKTDYIDTMLIHASAGNEHNLIAYKGLMKAREEGLIRFIGVSNWNVEEINYIKEHTGEYPKYNQIVCSVTQRLVVTEMFCKEHKITLMGYSSIRPYYNPNPFYPESDLTQEEKAVVDRIAKQHNVSPALVLLNWVYRHDYVILPKSTHPNRVIENFKAIQLHLSDAEMHDLDELVRYKDADFKKTVQEWMKSWAKR